MNELNFRDVIKKLNVYIRFFNFAFLLLYMGELEFAHRKLVKSITDFFNENLLFL